MFLWFLRGTNVFSSSDSDRLAPPVSLSPLCLPPQDDEVVLQCTATVHKEQQKLCLAAEGFGNRLCFLESTSNSKVGNSLERARCSGSACGAGGVGGALLLSAGRVDEVDAGDAFTVR